MNAAEMKFKVAGNGNTRVKNLKIVLDTKIFNTGEYLSQICPQPT